VFTFALLFSIMDKAAELVSSALLGLDSEVVFVGGKAYVVKSPTIKRLAGVANELSKTDFGQAETLPQMLAACKDAEALSRALSWLIQGDDKLGEELSHARVEEVLAALTKGFALMSPQVFLIAVGLTKSAARLAAR